MRPFSVEVVDLGVQLERPLRAGKVGSLPDRVLPVADGHGFRHRQNFINGQDLPVVQDHVRARPGES